MQILATETLKQLPATILPRLIAIFASTTPELLIEIQQAATKGDLHGMAQAAHKLKGSCVSLGAEQMADLCKTLQDKGEANEGVDVQGYIADLNKLYPATLAALQNS